MARTGFKWDKLEDLRVHSFVKQMKASFFEESKGAGQRLARAGQTPDTPDGYGDMGDGGQVRRPDRPQVPAEHVPGGGVPRRWHGRLPLPPPTSHSGSKHTNIHTHTHRERERLTHTRINNTRSHTRTHARPHPYTKRTLKKDVCAHQDTTNPEGPWPRPAVGGSWGLWKGRRAAGTSGMPLDDCLNPPLEKFSGGVTCPTKVDR